MRAIAGGAQPTLRELAQETVGGVRPTRRRRVRPWPDGTPPIQGVRRSSRARIELASGLLSVPKRSAAVYNEMGEIKPIVDELRDELDLTKAKGK